MTQGLYRYHQSGQSHFLTFSCYRRQPYFCSVGVYDLFVACLEEMRLRFRMYVYGYAVMPEHVHLLVSEPERETLAEAMHCLKLSFSKRVRNSAQVSVQRKDANLGHRPLSGPFWQVRYHDRNVRNIKEFQAKLDYMHQNPVKRGLVKEASGWKWTSFRHYANREVGVVEIESEWTARDRETKRTGGPERVFLSPDKTLV